MKNTLLILCAASVLSCSTSVSQKPDLSEPMDFNDYWYSGEAEITSYDLEQSRYGEVHRGKSVLVFVTEPFSKSKQVKLDNWRDSSDDNVSVLKLNMTKKFITGIYPYSMMMSSFTPVSYDKYPSAFKVTSSSQEWCGQTWMQLNLKEDGYHLKGYSYFESEGDISEAIDDVLLEDQLWSKVRLSPQDLPIGETTLFPSTFYLRLKHRAMKPKKAKLSLAQVNTSDYSASSHSKYSIEYADRSLTIYFETNFPHTILGWEETYGQRTTKAKKINTIKSPYWSKNSDSDRELRKELGLEME